MIFATVGTHAQPFARFFTIVQAVQELGHEVVLQYGHNPAPRNLPSARAFMPYQEIVAHVEAADAVMTHAGVGSLLTARRAGHCPIVLARLRRHGEHVDDHQDELTRRLAPLGHVLLVDDPTQVAQALARATASRTPQELATTPLHGAVRAALSA